MAADFEELKELASHIKAQGDEAGFSTEQIAEADFFLRFVERHWEGPLEWPEYEARVDMALQADLVNGDGFLTEQELADNFSDVPPSGGGQP